MIELYADPHSFYVCTHGASFYLPIIVGPHHAKQLELKGIPVITRDEYKSALSLLETFNKLIYGQKESKV